MANPGIAEHATAGSLAFQSEEKESDKRSIGPNSTDADSIRALKQIEGEAFASGGETRYYEPIDSYEGKHRWDPKAEWTTTEEKHVIRKLDMRICSWACLMFFALQLDRGNISQALSDNFLTDLGLNTNQYNYGQSIFYISFLCAELPS